MNVAVKQRLYCFIFLIKGLSTGTEKVNLKMITTSGTQKVIS